MSVATPKVSVIIPVYNAEKYLRQCLDSVVNQSLREIEIICVDDGSTDGSLNILREYEERDDRIRVLQQKNLFAGVARNSGIKIAQGTFCAFLDSDDYYEIDGLEQLYVEAEEQNVDFIKARSYLLDAETGVITTSDYFDNGQFSKNQTGRVYFFEEAPRKFLNTADVPWNGLYRTSFLRENEIRFNNLRCVNDHSFYITCLVYAKRILTTDQYLTYYRRNQSQSLIGIRGKHFDCQLASYSIVKEIISKEDIDLKDATKRLVMQYELNQVFTWYEKLLVAGMDSMRLSEQISSFAQTLDRTDVGAEYIKKFSYSAAFMRAYNRQPMQAVERNEQPDVSVVIPMYNAAAYITECLESLVSQTMQNIEIICIDDGSNDRTVEIVKELSAIDNRIILLSQNHKYAGVARNTGVRAASRKYIAFVDADDKVSEDFAQKMYDEAERTQADVVVSPLFAWNGKQEKWLMRHWLEEKYLPGKRPFSCEDIPEHILVFTPGGPGGKLFRKDFVLLNRVEFLDFKRSEDFNFVLYAIVRAERISTISEALYYYRQNNQMSLESTKDETPTIFWDATMKFKERLEKENCLEPIKQSFINNAINRFAFNVQALKSFAGYEEAFVKLKEVYIEELELPLHSEEYFFNKPNYRVLSTMVKYDSCNDYLFAEAKRLKKNEEKMQKELGARNLNAGNLNAGKSDITDVRFRDIVSLLFRKIRGGIRCYQEHGWKYTCQRVLVHLGLKKDPYR